MHRINYKKRLCLFILFLSGCCYLIPNFIINKNIFVDGSKEKEYVSFFLMMVVGCLVSIVGIVMELKKNMKPEQKIQATLSQAPKKAFEDDFESASFIDRISGAFCATFYLDDGTLRRLHFRSKKSKKILLKYNNKKMEIYYKEVSGKYWLTGFDASQNLMK